MTNKLEKVNRTQTMSLIGRTASYQAKTIQDALKSEGKALAVHRKETSEEHVLAALVVMIDKTVKFFSVGKTMNGEQVAETARLILKEFYYLKFEDLVIFFDRLKTGFYGQIFDRIDGNVILVNLRQYSEERFFEAEKITLERHKEIKSEAEKNILIQVGLNWVRENGDIFAEVEHKELATLFSYGTACTVREWLVKKYFQTNPESVKLVNAKKVTSILDYLEHHKPELLPEKEAYKRGTNEYFEMKKAILEDETKTPLEKENAIRYLAGLEPITDEEYGVR